MNAFLLLGVPIIRALSGAAGGEMGVPAVMTKDWEGRRELSRFRKVAYVKLNSGTPPAAEPVTGKTESFRVLAEADGYVVVPEGTSAIPKGSAVIVSLLPGFSFS